MRNLVRELYYKKSDFIILPSKLSFHKKCLKFRNKKFTIRDLLQVTWYELEICLNLLWEICFHMKYSVRILLEEIFVQKILFDWKKICFEKTKKFGLKKLRRKKANFSNSNPNSLDLHSNLSSGRPASSSDK